MRQLLIITFLLLITLASFTPLSAQDEQQQVLAGMNKVTDMLSAIRENYYGDLDPYNLVENAIRGMLAQLDPHSNYISPEQVRQLTSQQQGEYYGVGMTVGFRDGVFYCVQPQPGSPAETAGLRAGDQILAIAGKSTADFSYQENAERLRGPRGTEVSITVQRPGYDKHLEFVVIRDRISLKTVPYAFMIDDSTGYIRINSFNHATHLEVREQLLKLLRHGMDRLVLDLRSNPGGDLDASVGVADLFVDSGKIVYTKGLNGRNKLEYSADHNTTLFDGPMIVMINNASASGAEVVTGALQDHDRAWVVGEKSWGKGLVQTQFPLEYGALLSLTTAKYYTPSGRLIQKPYEAGNFEEYFNTESDKDIKTDNLDAAMTDLGRVVYGGNGIMPDEIIHSTPASQKIQQIMARGLIFDFVNKMLSKNPEISDDFYADGKIMKDLRSFLKSREIEYDDDSWKEDFTFLAARTTLQVHNRGKGPEFGFKKVLHTDKQLQDALRSFDKAQNLLARRSKEISTIQN